MRKIGILFLLVFCTGLFGVGKLRVYDEKGPQITLFETSDNKEIAHELQKIAVRFEQWQLRPLPAGCSNEEILSIYGKEVAQLVKENGYQSIDVARIFPDAPHRETARKKFLDEHIHTEDEVRFFVEGSGLFSLHVGDRVYLVLCEEGDLISVPANYRHWFDMSAAPRFTAIRFFLNPDGWIPAFTGDEIAKQFPQYEVAF